MYLIRLDVHKKSISSCVKDAAGRVHQDGERETTPAVCQDTEGPHSSLAYWIQPVIWQVPPCPSEP